MSTRVCTECGASASEDADACEACGAPRKPQRRDEGHESNESHEDSEPRARDDAHAAPSAPEAPAAANGATEHVSASEQQPQEHDAATHADDANGQTAHAPAASERQPRSEASAHGEAASEGVSADLQGRTSHGTHAQQTVAQARAMGSVETHDSAIAATSQPKRPPVLASEALLRDIAPAQPARGALRLWCPLLGVLGTVNAWTLTSGHGLGWLLASAFAALALLGLPPMPYQGRAAAVTTVSATGLVLLLWSDASSPTAATRVALTVSVTLLASGLLFRSWHRASRLSRLIVALGVSLASLCVWLNGDLVDLTLVDTEWQSWLPHVFGLAFCMLLLLSLLAFMDARSTGGATVWAVSILCWNALYSGISIIHDAWPKWAQGLDFNRLSTTALLVRTSTPLLITLLSISVAQLLAAGVADSTQRRGVTSSRGSRSSLRDFSTPAPRSH